MSNQSDSELMKSYADGDLHAFGELFRRYEGRAFGFFLRRTGSEDRASDLKQEFFLRLHRFRDQFDPIRPFAPWFFQIARNVLADEFRRSMRHREVSFELASLATIEPDAERRITQRQQVSEFLDLIPPEQGAVLVAAKVEGLQYSEIADRVGRSADAVRQAASRALRHLRLASQVAA